MIIKNIDEKVTNAVRIFWGTRENQQRNQGKSTGRKDSGSRGSVTGGSHLDGFIQIIYSTLVENGVEDPIIFYNRGKTIIPGYFRPEKSWDIIIVNKNQLISCVEFKSQVGSFGNNYNNRTEEAIGNACDLWTAYREGAFKTSPKPWIGYFMILEDSIKSQRPVKPKQPHFNVFPEFRSASYADRYQELCLRLLRERLYDGTAFILSDKTNGKDGSYKEPNPELTVERFLRSMIGHVTAMTGT
jgi:hypothetical protein